LVWEGLITIGVGCVIVTVAVPVHPNPSVIVQVYVAGVSEDAVAEVPPEGAQE
jgi:hypothetical protein